MRGAISDAEIASNSDAEFGDRTCGPVAEFASNSGVFFASKNGGRA